MKILIANDDGIRSAGIRALINALSPDHELYVTAPTKERSAMGHALTLYRPLRAEKYIHESVKDVEYAYAIDGTPTDCIKIGLNKILDFKPDLVISGINHGPNMGADIIYSGTVSIAMEGSMYGIKSIAFSLNDMKMENFEEEAKCIPMVIEKILKDNTEWPANTLFNVNIPSLTVTKGKELDEEDVVYTHLAKRMYTDAYEKRIDPRQKSYYWLSGELVENDPDEYSDVTQCRKGKIAVTPISLNFENDEVLHKLNNKIKR